MMQLRPFGLLGDIEDEENPSRYLQPGGGGVSAGAQAPAGYDALGRFAYGMTGAGGVQDAAGLLGGPSLSENLAAGNKFDATMQAASMAPVVGGALKGLLGGVKMAMAVPALSKAEKLAAARAKVPEDLLKVGDAAKANAAGLRGRTAYGPEADLVFNGKQPHEFTPEDWGAFGQQYGVPMGPASNAEFEASLVPYKTASGREFTVPGGVEDANKPMNYYDLLHLKAQGIDPNDLDPNLHRQLHNRMVNAVTPGYGQLGKEGIYNRFLMGLLSPNNPLTPNEFAVAATMAKEGQGDIARMAGMTPWSLDNMPPSSAQRPVRDEISKEIASKYGLQAGSKGGLGASGSVDYTRVSDFAKMMEERPDFFEFRGQGEGGRDKAAQWLNHVSRIASQVPGLSAKTGSFGAVWQKPNDAAISAIDRHMATEFTGQLFENAKEQKAFEKTVVDKFNEGKPRKDRIKTYADVVDAPGGRGFFVDQVMNVVNKHGGAKFRNAKGEINPNVPEEMRGVDWVREPQEVTKVSPAYLRALEENDRIARQNNQGLFANQWMLWDRIRNRVEPHEIMYPGLEKVPRMSQAQHRAALAEHNKAGYLTSPNPVRPVINPSSLAYFSLGAGVPLGLLSSQAGSDESAPTF